MNRLYQIGGVLVVIIGLLFLFLGASEQNLTALITILVFSLGLIALGFYCLLWYLNHQLNFNKETVSARNLYVKSKSLNWKNITNITFNSFSGQITLTDTKGAKVKAHQHLAGLNSFIEHMEQHTKWTVKSLKSPLKRNDYLT